MDEQAPHSESDPQAPILLTIRDCAHLCRVKPQTIRRWIRRGKFPRGRVLSHRRTVRWLREDIEQFVHSLPRSGPDGKPEAQ